MANAFVVTYDLKQQGQNYTCIIKKLEAYPNHWHMQGSVWILRSPDTAAQIRDNLKSCLDANDNLFVGRLSGEAAWWGFTEAGGTWLKDALTK
jgi:CRISPR associated protein Cas2